MISVAKINISWHRSQRNSNANPILKKFARWMTDHGYRDASIDDYLRAIGLFLRTIGTVTPSIEDAREYHSNMAASNLARATVNIRRAALEYS